MLQFFLTTVNLMDNRMKLYHGAVTTAPLCKNGSEKYGVTASVKVAFSPEAHVVEFDMHGRNTDEAKRKLFEFLSDDDQVELEQFSIKGQMTKERAILAMKLGERVTHTYFSRDEFIRMEDGKIVDENGYRFTASEFWQYRTAEIFATGWSVKLSS
jgi:hypothetical protein